MLEQIIVVDYVDGAGGEYLSEFLNRHLHATDHVWLRKYFNSQSLVIDHWDRDFDQHLQKFLLLCQDQGVTKIAVPYHLYKWPTHLVKFQGIANVVRAVRISSDQYQRQVALDFLRKIYLLPVDDLHKLAYLTKTASTEQKQKLLEHLRARTLQWIDVILLTSNHDSRQQLVDQVLTRQLTCPSQDLSIDYGDFYVHHHNIDNKYNLLCRQLNLVPNQALLQQLIQRNQRNWIELTDYADQFEEIYKQLWPKNTAPNYKNYF